MNRQTKRRFGSVLGVVATAGILSFSLPATSADAQQADAVRSASAAGPASAIDYLAIDRNIKLRRMVLANPNSKGIVLLLHGFPETLYAWEKIAPALAADFEVHAIDWPGYGLSSRPPPEQFSYSPREYARVLDDYVERAGIDSSKLTIYATDIGALPALLLAIEKPAIARRIIVGDFAPFDRPEYMHERLQGLKSPASAEKVRAVMNQTRDEILANAFMRGLPSDARYDISPEFSQDMARGWGHGGLTTADAFYHYYAHFTRDQDHFEANLARLRTPVTVIWGEQDPYIDRKMGAEFAERVNAEFTLLPGIGHYPHLQSPEMTIEEIRSADR